MNLSEKVLYVRVFGLKEKTPRAKIVRKKARRVSRHELFAEGQKEEDLVVKVIYHVEG